MIATPIQALHASASAGTVLPERRRGLRLTFCPTEFDRFARAMTGGPADATDIIQRYLARLLSERGHDVTFFAPRAGRRSVTSRDVRRAIPSRATWTANPLFALAEKASWYIQRGLGIPYLNEFSQLRIADEAYSAVSGADLVYERSYLYRDGISRACRRTNTPYVLFVEADEILEYDYMGRGLKGLLRSRAEQAFQRNLEAADCILCVSSQLRDHLAEHWGVPPSKMLVFQNAVDVERFRPDPQAGAAIRRSLGVGDDPLLVFTGAFYRWHDVPSLLRAYRDVLANKPKVRLVLVGDGAERGEMMNLTRSLGVADQAIFTGRVPHEAVPGYLAAADIAVAPYPAMDQQMWLSPLKVYEAMAAGAPVITSSLGQLADLIEGGRTGLLVPPGDDRALAEAIDTLLDQPALRAAISSRARRRAVARHSWQSYMDRLERVFEAVAERRPVTGI